MRGVRGSEDGELVDADRRDRPRGRRLVGELARDRDRLLYRRVVDGLPVKHAARQFRISRQLAHRRIAALPLWVKRGIEAEARAEGTLRCSIVQTMMREAAAQDRGPR